jgi:hypothetical protein
MLFGRGEDTAFKVAKYIREEMKNNKIRIILRTDSLAELLKI